MREAIILAGGFGTRLRHVVSDVPKPMAPIGGRPFLEYLLDRLNKQEYSHTVLATGYMHEVVEAHFGNQYKGLRISYARETSPLGTGGAIVNAMQHCQSESITILNGDTLFLADLTKLQEKAREKRGKLTMVLREVEDAGRYGAVRLDEEGKIINFSEKDATSGRGLINGGIYQLSPALLSEWKRGDNFSFEKEVLQKEYTAEPFYAYAEEAYFIDIGVPEDYARAQKELPLL